MKGRKDELGRKEVEGKEGKERKEGRKKEKKDRGFESLDAYLHCGLKRAPTDASHCRHVGHLLI